MIDTTVNMKKCTKCGNEFPADTDHFYADNRRPSGLASECKECSSKRHAAGFQRRMNDPAFRQRLHDKQAVKMQKYGDAIRAGAEPRRIRKYGLTEERYKKMVDEQGGLCAMCSVNPIEVIDHDHRTGEVRGLLCHECNRTLDVYEKVKSLAESYLSRMGVSDVVA